MSHADCKVYTQYPTLHTSTITATATATASATASVFVGIGGFREIAWYNLSAEMGIILHPDYYGMGICTEVHYICLLYGFEILNLNRITFTTTSTNKPMKTFLESVCRATFEGKKRELFFIQNNERSKGVVDADCYSILASEWMICKQSLMTHMKSC